MNSSLSPNFGESVFAVFEDPHASVLGHTSLQAAERQILKAPPNATFKEPILANLVHFP